MYELIPDNGAAGDVFVFSGRVLYQALGEEFHFFRRVEQRPIYINFSPRNPA